MSEPNLNPWWAVKWRTFTRWCREFFFKFNTPIRRRLWDERRLLMNPYPLRAVTDKENKRISDIGWWLGMNSVFYLTSEQQKRQYEIAREVVERLKEEGKINGPYSRN